MYILILCRLSGLCRPRTSIYYAIPSMSLMSIRQLNPAKRRKLALHQGSAADWRDLESRHCHNLATTPSTLESLKLKRPGDYIMKNRNCPFEIPESLLTEWHNHIDPASTQSAAIWALYVFKTCLTLKDCFNILLSN
jgi:hypothetical protein